MPNLVEVFRLPELSTQTVGNRGAFPNQYFPKLAETNGVEDRPDGFFRVSPAIIVGDKIILDFSKD